MIFFRNNIFSKKTISLRKADRRCRARSTTGFTLIELVVVIGILSLLSTSLITYSRAGEKQIVFFKEQSVLVSAIFRAKNLAISTYGRNGADSCGYGIHFSSPQEVIIFNDRTDTDCSAADKKYTSSDEKEKVEKIILDSKVRIANSPQDFIFIPPMPTVFPKQDFTVRLEMDDNSKSATINISSAGQITTQ